MAYFKVYIINGSGGSGKDTFCNLVWTASKVRLKI